MTNPPSQNLSGTWVEGTATFTMWSGNDGGVRALLTDGGGIDNPVNLGLVPDGTGLRLTYPPALWPGGNSPVRFGAGFSSNGTGVLYVRHRIRFSGNWSTNGNVGTKLSEPRTLGAENHVFNTFEDTSDSQAYPVFLLQGPNGHFANVPPGGAPTYSYGADYSPNAQAAELCCGVWHTLEWLLDMQAGTVTIWVDGTNGTPVYSQSGVSFIASGETFGWGYLMFDPTYGDGSNSPSNTSPNIYWDLDQLHVSVK